MHESAPSRRREPEDGGALVAAGEGDARVEVGVLHEEARAANYAAGEAEGSNLACRATVSLI